MPVVSFRGLSQKAARVPSPFSVVESIRGETGFMSTRTVVVCLCALTALGGAAPAMAQYSNSANRATGENYHVEVTGALWDPTPQILIRSESIRGIIGSDIDFVEDLGIEKS